MTKRNILSLLACLLTSTGSASAITLSGSITVGDGTLVGGGGWSTATGGLSWVVDDTTNAGNWTYTYTFNLPGFSPDISHAIVEVTDGAVLSNFTVDAGGGEVEIGTFGSNSGNPGILGDIFGIKVNTPDDTDEPWSWTIVTDRNPVWQDFYAKGGSDSYAHNSGYLAIDPTGAAANGSLAGHILGPNGLTPTTFSTPDGGTTVALMGLAVGGLGLLRRFMPKA